MRLLLALLLLASAPCAQAKQPPSKALGLMRKGIAAYEGARFDECVSLLSKALSMRPGWKTASGFRAMCRWTTGDIAAAKADAKLAAGLVPNNAESFCARGFAHFVLKRFEPATQDFEKAVEADPGYAPAHFGIGSVYSQRNMPKDALPHLDEAVKHAPDAAVMRIVRGTVREKLRNFQGAVEDYDAVLRVAPGFEWAHFYRGRAYREIKQYAKSEQDFDAFLKRNPESEDALYLRSNVYFQTGDYEAAIKDLDRIIALNPKHGLAYANRGVVRAQMGEKIEAMADLAKAKALLPDKADKIEAQIRQLRDEKTPQAQAGEGPSGVAADALLPGEKIQEPEHGKPDKKQASAKGEADKNESLPDE